MILEALQVNPFVCMCNCEGPGISNETSGAIDFLTGVRNYSIIPFLAEKAACYIIMVSQLSNREEMGDLAVLPMEILSMIAKEVFASRKDRAWIELYKRTIDSAEVKKISDQWTPEGGIPDELMRESIFNCYCHGVYD